MNVITVNVIAYLKYFWKVKTAEVDDGEMRKIRNCSLNVNIFSTDQDREYHYICVSFNDFHCKYLDIQQAYRNALFMPFWIV